MSLKRSARRQLTQDNWDDPDQEEGAGDDEETVATPEMLSRRVIRTAKRRNPAQNEDQAKRGIFSGFSAFQKPASDASSAFSFISKLAPSGESTEVKSDPPKNKTDSETPKPFTFSVDKKIDPPDSSRPFTFSTDKKPQAAQPSKPFTFSTTKTVDSAPTPLNGGAKDASSNEKSQAMLKSDPEYFENLRSLNLSIVEWIETNVDKNPYCILTPVFDDYMKHLSELEKLKKNKSPLGDSNKNENRPTQNTIPPCTSNFNPPTTSKTSSSLFNFPSSSNTANINVPTTSKSDTPAATFRFPVSSNTSVPASSPEKPKPFTFPVTSTAKPFAFPVSATSTPFSFPVTAMTASAPSETNDEEEDDEPPKVTFAPVVEEDSVYSKRCKVFVKKEDAFSDRGVGTLFLKPIKDSEKHQLIVRADTSLGNLLLNIVLSKSVPAQRTGKNNVMLICVPTADAPPTPVQTLIRVKSAEEADELLEILNKYKK